MPGDDDRRRGRGRPQKTLRDLVLDGTFLSRRHRQLLDEDPMLAPGPLRRLQKRYQDADHDLERVSLSREFERLARQLARERKSTSRIRLEEELNKLGPPGSAKRVTGFFPRFLTWDDGSPFRLDRFQRDFIRDAYRRDDAGQRIFKEILLGVPRGEGKTPLASGLGCYELLDSPGRPKVFQAAGAKEQALLGLEYVANWTEDGRLGDYLDARAKVVRRRDGRGYFAIISAAGGLGHGRKPTVGIADELWAFTVYAQTQTYTAIETALHKIPDSYLLAITTAGHDKATLLGEQFDTALKLPDVRTFRQGFLTVARDVESGRLMWWYGLPDGYELDVDNEHAVLRAIKLANPGSWVDHHSLLRAFLRARSKGDINEWTRLALNGWTKTAGAWLPVGLWPSLASDAVIPEGGEVFVGVDVGLVHDSTAVVWAHRLEDGRIVVRSDIFSAVEDTPHHHFHRGGRVNLEAVEDFILARAREEGWVIRELVYDPRFFERSAQRLADEGLDVAELPQSSAMMADAYQTFYAECREGHVTHDGQDKAFAAHVEATGADLTERGWKVRKLKNSARIDACVAACMAVWRAFRHDPTSHYETGDLVVL